MALLCAPKRSRQIRHRADGKRASGGPHASPKHRAASAGLLATAGEPASCVFLVIDALLPHAQPLARLRFLVALFTASTIPSSRSPEEEE
jgi:hypothetical protein